MPIHKIDSFAVAVRTAALLMAVGLASTACGNNELPAGVTFVPRAESTTTVPTTSAKSPAPTSTPPARTPTPLLAPEPSVEVEEPSVEVGEPVRPPETQTADWHGYVEADRYRVTDGDHYRYRFKSPTGSLDCQISVPVIKNGDYAIGSTACGVLGRPGAQPYDQYCNATNVSGAALFPSHAQLSCGSTAPGSSYLVLDYGNKIRVDDFECMSERTGITCHYGVPGFKIAREQVVLF